MGRLAQGALASVVVWLCVGVVGAAEPPGDYHKDERWGFRVRTPKGWDHAAMSASESWIASKHISRRELSAKKKVGWIERPEMWVVAFPHERADDRGAKVEEKDGVPKVTIQNPYRDYKDFLKREPWFVGGGYYFSKEETGEVDGMRVTMYEVKVEKMVDSPFRMVAWVYHSNDVDFAVQFRILEDWYDDYARTFETCLRSFRRIERTAAMPGGETTGEKITEVEDESKLTPEERMRRRKDRVEATLAKEIAALPKDWISLRSEHYIALSHADEKFTKETLDFAESVRGYLDETFPLGDDYVPPGIIRIFATQAEESAFFKGTGFGLFEGAEQIALSKRTGEEKSWEYEYLGRRVTDQWLEFKNRLLSDNMPYWIREGLKRHMSFARPKGKRIEFKPDAYDREDLRKVVKEGKAIPLKDLFSGDDEQFTQHAHLLQAGSVVSWLLGEGNRGKVKNAVFRYLQALMQACEEEEKAYEEKRKAAIEGMAKRTVEGAGEEGERTEEEEDRREEEIEKELEKGFNEMRDAWKAKGKAIREKAFECAFPDLKDSDWAKLDAAWQKFGG